MDPSKTVQRRDGRTLDGVRWMIPSRLPSILLVTQTLNGTGTGPSNPYCTVMVRSPNNTLDSRACGHRR